MDAFSLEGRLALVVGAGGGIGQATARMLGALGASLRLADLQAPSALAADLATYGVTAEAVACDISDRRAAEQLLWACPEIDILVVASAICPWDD